MRTSTHATDIATAEQARSSRFHSAKRVFVLYGYANLPQDAIARIVNELAESLGDHALDVRVLGMPARLSRPMNTSLAKAWYAANELGFLVRCATLVLLQLRKTKAIVTLEYPAGTPLVGVLARWISRGRVMDIAWLMDLYDLMPGHREKRGRVATLKSQLSLAGVARVRHRVVLGQCMQDALRKNSGLSSTVIPLWHRATEVAHETRDAGRSEFLYSGNARDIHPLSSLGAAMAGHAGEDGAILRVAGGGASVAALAAFAKEHHVASIEVGGFVAEDELFESYSRALVHVVSLAESATGTCVPSKTYAAMAAGRAILYLGSSTGQAARDVLEAGCGIVVPTESVQDISAAIRTLTADTKSTINMGDKAKTFWSQYRSVEAVTPAWLEMLSGAR